MGQKSGFPFKHKMRTPQPPPVLCDSLFNYSCAVSGWAEPAASSAALRGSSREARGAGEGAGPGEGIRGAGHSPGARGPELGATARSRAERERLVPGTAAGATGMGWDRVESPGLLGCGGHASWVPARVGWY